MQLLWRILRSKKETSSKEKKEIGSKESVVLAGFFILSPCG
jgi:hypothetical protein